MICERLRSPLSALAWEIWRQKRWWFCVSAALTIAAYVFNLCFPAAVRYTATGYDRLLPINGFMVAGTLLLIFGAFNYTGFNPQKEWTGFPYHLFTLPVKTVVLVTVPLALGVLAVETVFVAWAKFAFTFNERMSAPWMAVLIGAYMIFYQTILWVLAAFRSLRVITLALTGTSFVGVAFLPALGEYISSPWLSEGFGMAMMAGLVVVAFFIAWFGVARQRFGGGQRRNIVRAWLDWVEDRLPRRERPFRSAADAQFWFEWRRSGHLLPLCFAAILIVVVLPLSWHLRHDPNAVVWILGWTLATPMILAVPIGKGFSKPDFWSPSLSVSSFLATRPLATGEWIVIKMKVAALSTILTWTLVLAFLSAWLPLWANLDSLNSVRVVLWMVHGHSVYPQYILAGLGFIAAALVTWKFLVNGLWIGLSGRRRLFVGSAALYGFICLAGMITLTIVMNREEGTEHPVPFDPDRLIAAVQWIAAGAVVAKFGWAACSWRNIRRFRVQQYLWLWLGGTVGLIAGAVMTWADGTLSALLMAVLGFPPIDNLRLASLLVLGALLIIPFARLGLAPAALTKNRHGL